MTIKFVKTAQEVEMYGTAFSLRKPTVGELKCFNKRMTEGEPELDLMCDFLISLGVPDELVPEMEIAHMTELVENAISRTEEKK